MHASVMIRAPLCTTKRVWLEESKISCTFSSHSFRELEFRSAAVFIHKCGKEQTVSAPTKTKTQVSRIQRASALGIV